MNAKNLIRFTAILFFVLISFFCSQKKPEVLPQQMTKFNLLSEEADLLYDRGSYTSLKQAYSIYKNLQTYPDFQNRTLKKLAKTALLLAIRENELFIIGDEYLIKALDLIGSYPELSDFSSYAAIVIFSSKRGTGITRRGLNGQYNREEYTQWTKKNIVQLNADLKDKAETDVFYAYFYLSLNAEFPYHISKEDDFTRFSTIFPNSPLIRYKLSVFPKFDQKRIEVLLQGDPEFYEAYFFLGDKALNLGSTLTAEKNLLQAYEQIPASISVLTLLTQIHFLLEEFDLSLMYNENILVLAPEYRDSLLGKAICLGYLGRHEEALDILNTLIELGMYLMGESHYWLAWNYHETGQLESAWENIRRASNYLVGHFEVHSLAGIIAFDRAEIEASEDQFKKALWMNQDDCEASFYMGKILGLRNEWEQSGINFERAALCNAGMENALKDKIKEIETSTFNPSRKQKYLTKKRIQMKKVQVAKATSFYNAAAGYFNVGQNEKALELALSAKDSKTLLPRVEELIDKIKNKINLEYSRLLLDKTLENVQTQFY
ncbi:tetratricopeptide repeat protein [Acidobacteriota bacterium]